MEVASRLRAPSSALDTSHRNKLLLVLLASLAIQILIASLPSVGDSQIYRLWIRGLANEGLAAAYWDKPIASATGTEAYYYVDYPPVYPYLLYAEGIVLKKAMPTLFQTNDRLLVFFIKVPFILANLLICLLLFNECRRRTTERRAATAAAAYAFNPAVLIITCYWGQSDSICGLLLLAAMICIVRKQPELSSILLTLSVFTKPIAYPFVILFLLATGKQFGWRRVLSSVFVASLTTYIIFLPFAWIGRLDDVYKSMALQTETMPWVSSNAHNLWWIVTGGLPWVDANSTVFGFVTYKLIGVFLYGVFCIATLRKYWMSNMNGNIFFVCAALAFGLFTLSTHMHAYHLFYTLLFLSSLLAESPRLWTLYFLVTLTSFANMLLYDVNFIYLSRAGMLLTLLNSQLCLALFLYWLFLFFAKESSMLPTRSMLTVMATVFLLVTAVPTLQKVARFGIEHFFLTNWELAEKKAPAQNYIRESSFMIDNDIRPVLFQHPPSEVIYNWKVPNRCRLRFGIALAPSVWAPEKGDGVSFAISVSEQGTPRTLFSTYIDPKTNVAQRRWIDQELDFSRYAGKEIRVTFITASGPANDNRFDWAAWGDPRIICN